VVRPEEGLEVARVWEEARKALTVQEWTEREGLYRFQVVAYERDLDPGAQEIQSETRRVTIGVSRNPIRSLPAEDLMENGFIRHLQDGELNYFSPDAQVLLSDEFLDSHCFRLTSDSDHETMIGLAFEPVRRSNFKDVEGTLWLDRGTAALRLLEHGYTWARYQAAQGVARGHVEFEGLPNGSWIVRKWWIRMPQLGQNLMLAMDGRQGISVIGIREAGGEITRINTLGSQRLAQVERGTVSGVVWDTTRHAPLEGALVYLSGTSFAGTTDAEGRFLIEGVSEGVFTAAFTHPRLDTLDLRAKGVDVEIKPGELTEVHLGVPSSKNILLEACGGEERALGTAVVTGIVRDRSTRQRLPGATVRFDWQAVLPAGSGRISDQDRWVEIPTDSRGRYTVCSVPSNELIVIQGTFLEQASDPVQISVLEDSYTVLDLEIDLPSGS